VDVVLVEPEIPANTGNIARTCVLTETTLHLVHPLGFSLEDRYLKRAGLDYWPHLKLEQHASLAEVEERYTSHPFFYVTTHGVFPYHKVSYPPDAFLVFGKETAGLGRDVIIPRRQKTIRIPMVEWSDRSLNLSNAVAIVLYEAYRQQGFPGMV